MTDELDIVVDVRAVIPVSEQIRAQIADLIRSGRLTDGLRLPTVRALAADLGVAVNTVNKAYAALDHDGLIISRRRAGTRVTRPTQEHGSAKATRKAIGLLVEAAHTEQLDEETIIALVREALKNSPHARA